MAKAGDLTPKQAAFVREYLLDGNGTQAAIRAGYSAKTAQEQSSRLLSNVMVAKMVRAAQEKVAEKTETEAEWVRRRLKEEADDFSEFASHSARIKALELVGRINGVFEKDNTQVVDGLAKLLGNLGGSVTGVVRTPQPDHDDDEAA